MATNLRSFLKANKKTKENTKFPATKSLCDENGAPLEWEVKPISTRENDAIREACTKEIQITGKPGMYREQFDSTLYLKKLVCASVVFPNLYDKELQDSYGVKTPEDLIVEMLDNPMEYNDFALFIQDYNGFDESVNDKVEQAKN